MNAILTAVYEREPSVIKKSDHRAKWVLDWTKCECLIIDRADDRRFAGQNGVRITLDGVDVTSKNLSDYFLVRLSSQATSKDSRFDTREAANGFIQSLLKCSALRGWKKTYQKPTEN